MSNLNMDKKLSALWKELTREVREMSNFKGRKLRSFKINNEHRFRLSCVSPGEYIELLIETESDREKSFYTLPKWQGMKFDLIEIDVPNEGTRYFCLRLENEAFRDIFVAVCADLAEILERDPSKNREEIFIEFVNRWTSFFKNFGDKKLSLSRQQGLFGELWWIAQLLEKNIPPIKILSSWIGCERSYHDFDFEGNVVEVKTTMTKEPRKVWINNERQLDPKGLISLHLLVLSTVKSTKGGQSLPAMINSIYSKFLNNHSCYLKFTEKLQNAGYIKSHSRGYTETFTISKNELFEVKDDFPNITKFPDGIGDIKYSLTVSVLKKFLINTERYIADRISS